MLQYIKHILTFVILLLFLVSFGLLLWVVAEMLGKTGQQFYGVDAFGLTIEFIFFLASTGLLGTILIVLRRRRHNHP
jgi:uncharacterized BrkB/YihY/UPF0761 family membrane protein